MSLRYVVAAILAAGTPLVAQAPLPTYILVDLVGEATGDGYKARDVHDGAAATARFNAPRAIAIAPDGVVYVADTSAIRRIATDGTVTTLAGRVHLSGSVDGIGSAARFGTISGLAVAPNGDLIVADRNHTIRKVTPAGVVTTLAGLAGVTGVTNGPGSTARFTSPSGVAVDGGGTAYVVDRSCTLRTISASGEVRALAGLPGVCAQVDGTGTAARFLNPGAVAVDASGVVYVADVPQTHTDGRIRRVTPTGVVTTFGPRLTFPRAIAVAPSGDVRVLVGWNWYAPNPFMMSVFGGENAIVSLSSSGSRSTLITFQVPTFRTEAFDGLAVDAQGRTYYANRLGRVQTPLPFYFGIHRVTPDGVSTPWVGAVTDGPFQELNGLVRESTGDLIVSDYRASAGVSEIRRVSQGGVLGTVVATVARRVVDMALVSGQLYVAGGFEMNEIFRVDTGGVTTELVRMPSRVAALSPLPDGRLAVATQAGVFLITASGELTQLSTLRVADLAVDSAGMVWATDDRLHVIWRIAPDGTATTVAGQSGSSGQVDGPAATARFSHPRGISIGSDGTLFVLDDGGLRVMTPTGHVRATEAPGADQSLTHCAGACNAGDLAAGPDGSVYIADGTRLRQMVPAPGVALGLQASPLSMTVRTGETATFAVTATGSATLVVHWEVSTNNGGTWSVLDDPPAGGAGTQTLTLRSVALSMDGYRYRAVVSDAGFSLRSSSATLSVIGFGATPASMRFSASRAGSTGPFTWVTPPQPVTVAFAGATGSWTATSDQPWLTVSNGSGTGSGRFLVAVTDPGVFTAINQTARGSIVVTPSTAGLGPVILQVELWTVQSTGSSAQPFGNVDTPAQFATGLQGAVGVTGWALDDVGVTRVGIYRNCLAFDDPASCQTLFGTSMVFIGDAAFLAGARPDVEAQFSAGYPQKERAGWGYLLLTSMLPDVTTGLPFGGRGSLWLFAIATDVEGNSRLLGRTQSDSQPTGITMANDTIAKPFGAIDTPAQGETVSGILNNFGWALTPDSNTTGGEGGDILIPTNGSTMTVFIDGLPTALVRYNQCRGTVGNPVPLGVYCNDDVANIFGNATPQAVLTGRTGNPTRYRNLDANRAAIGSFTIDTTTLSNGLHTIAWSVTDSAGRTEGIGSRFFNVLNAGGGADGGAEAHALRRGEATTLAAYPTGDAGVWFRTGFDLTQSWIDLPLDAEGMRRLTVNEGGRVELWLGAPVDAGYLVVNGELRDLPVGSSLKGAQFVWTPPVGYVGEYPLVFVRGRERIDATIRVGPPGDATAAISEGQIAP